MHDAPRGANFLSLLIAIVGKSTHVWSRDENAIQIRGTDIAATKNMGRQVDGISDLTWKLRIARLRFSKHKQAFR